MEMAMSSINPLSKTHVSTAQAASGVAKPLGKFEINSKQYGPTVATAISVADTVGDVASAVYRFSDKSLQELAKLPSEAYDVAKDAVNTVGKAVDAVEDGVESVAHDVVSLASKGIKQVEMATNVSKTLNAGLTVANKATDVVSDAVTTVAKEVGTAAATVAGCAALGVGAAASKFSDLV
jgi:hypothetical protein